MLVKSQVKYIQSLGQKKFRDEAGVFIVEGPKMVRELLSAPALERVEIYAVKEWLLSLPAGAMGEGRVTEVKETELERISSLSTPNQVLAIFKKPSFAAPDLANTVTLVLDGIQDPGNFGTIVRIADWFGIRQVIASRDSADVFSPKAVQSTMGSIGRVQVRYEDPLTIIRQHPGLPVYAAILEGKSLYATGRIEKGMIVIGNESRGIRPELLEAASNGITIPRIGEAESLNAAVATGIILSHLVSGK